MLSNKFRQAVVDFKKIENTIGKDDVLGFFNIAERVHKYHELPEVFFDLFVLLKEKKTNLLNEYTDNDFESFKEGIFLLFDYVIKSIKWELAHNVYGDTYDFTVDSEMDMMVVHAENIDLFNLIEYVENKGMVVYAINLINVYMMACLYSENGNHSSFESITKYTI